MDAEHTGPTTPAPNPYELRLTGAGISVQRQITEEQALRVISLLMGVQSGESASGGVGRQQPASTSLTRTASSGGHITVGGYIEEVGARRNPDKILAIGAFLMDRLSMETFSREDVKGQFQNAGEATPANFARDFGTAVSNKWLAQPHGQKGQYYVTKTGHTALEKQFSTEGRRATARPARRRPRKKATASSDSG